MTVNNHAFTGAVPSLPWSGVRATGFGVANSVYSLQTFVRPRATRSWIEQRLPSSFGCRTTGRSGTWAASSPTFS